MTKIAKEIEALIAESNKVKNKIVKQNVQIKKVVEPIAIGDNTINIENIDVLKKRDECIEQLHAAKVSHKKWMSFVQILLRLGNVDEARTSIPINYTMCDFGKWYYGEGSRLTIFPEFNQMESNHKNIHDVYLQIFELYDTKIKNSFFNSSKKQIEKRNTKAKDLSKLMDQCSKVMFDLLIYIENELKMMSEKQLIALFISSIKKD